MNYNDSFLKNAANLYLLGDIMYGLKSGEYKVEEDGVLNKHGLYLNIIKFEMGDEVEFVISVYKRGNELPYVIFPWEIFENDTSAPEFIINRIKGTLGLQEEDQTKGAAMELLIKSLYTEIQKKFTESGVKDKWGEYYREKIDEFIKQREER